MVSKKSNRGSQKGSANYWIRGVVVLAIAIFAGSLIIYGSHPGEQERRDIHVEDDKDKDTEQPEKVQQSGRSETNSNDQAAVNDELFDEVDNIRTILQLVKEVQKLAAHNSLTPDIASKYLKYLVKLERKIRGSDPTTQNVRQVVQTVKAQLISLATGMSEEEVEDKYGVGTYSSSKFWDEHYKQGNSLHDWYFGWKTKLQDGRELGEWLQDIDVNSEVLMLGCGNSPMSFDMYQAGYKKLRNIDVSEAVIKQMKERYGAKMQNAAWQVMDARKLEYDDSFFDAVVDKGTLDALSIGSDRSTNMQAVISELRRTIRLGGTLVSIGSKSIPELENAEGFQCQIHEISKAGAEASQSELTGWYMHKCKRD
eukprot:gnl/MRDRNA2_/MRDRNA2_97320_c0_seq1.p1 gnl/MRDRNA2_/MRDRNA2_97320_c0~~gnl/MRDRNA2_/MRDRNA2_97320_c0_seq1.p1  ORF type:complete len:368 (-),score=75.57 gnl/MRDRNA2_/MRDRNA2_97320_c0_seq1:24-1127(-)